MRRFYGRELTTEWAAFEPHPHSLSPFRRWEMSRAQKPEATGDDRRAQLDVRSLVDAIFAAFRAGDREALGQLFPGLGEAMYHCRKMLLMPSALQVDAIYADRQIAFATSRPITGTVDRPQVIQIKLCKKNDRWVGRNVGIGELDHQRSSIVQFLSQHPDARVLPLGSDDVQAALPSQSPKTSLNETVEGAGMPERTSPDICSLRLDGRDDHLRVPHSQSLALAPPFTGKERGLVALWAFDEGQGQVACDRSPNHNDAVLGTSFGPDEADPKWTR